MFSVDREKAAGTRPLGLPDVRKEHDAGLAEQFRVAHVLAA